MFQRPAGEKSLNCSDNYNVFHRLRLLLTCSSGQSLMMREESDLQKTLTDFFFMLVKRKQEEKEKGTSLSGNPAATAKCRVHVCGVSSVVSQAWRAAWKAAQLRESSQSYFIHFTAKHISKYTFSSPV